MMNNPPVDEGILEQIIVDIETHDREYPNHGVGCACHDKHAGRIRRLMLGLNEKSRRNLIVILGYLRR